MSSRQPTPPHGFLLPDDKRVSARGEDTAERYRQVPQVALSANLPPTLPGPPHKPPPLLTSWLRPLTSVLPLDTSGAYKPPKLESSFRGLAKLPSRPGPWRTGNDKEAL